MNVKSLINITLIFFVCGCTTQQMAVRMALPLVEVQVRSIQEEGDPYLAEAAIPASLKMMEGFLQEDRDNPVLLTRLAEGFCGYAFSFLEESDPDRAVALYRRGRDYAFRAVAAQTGSNVLQGSGREEFDAALAGMNEAQVASLFWLGQCWAGWLNLSLDNPVAFADITKLEKLMLRVLQLDPGYHYAGAHLSLGIFYGSRSKMLGGNPEKARFHFEKNMELTERRFLLTPFFYAKTYAVQFQDRELFERLLREVLQTPSDILPEQRLANEVAKLKAKRLLNRADDLF